MTAKKVLAVVMFCVKTVGVLGAGWIVLQILYNVLGTACIPLTVAIGVSIVWMQSIYKYVNSTQRLAECTKEVSATILDTKVKVGWLDAFNKCSLFRYKYTIKYTINKQVYKQTTNWLENTTNNFICNPDRPNKCTGYCKDDKLKYRKGIGYQLAIELTGSVAIGYLMISLLLL